MATEDARYRQSTQYRLWSFSPVQLATMRSKTNELAKRNISVRLASGNSAPTSSSNTPDPEGGAPASSAPEFLTPAEEDLLLRYYTGEVLRAGEFSNLLTEVKSTAAVFFRRFYITNSVMTYQPRDMLLVALFFANKVEGHFLNVDKWVQPLSPRQLSKEQSSDWVCKKVRGGIQGEAGEHSGWGVSAVPGHSLCLGRATPIPAS